MNLLDFVDKFVGVFSFSEEEKKVIKDDLLKVIYSEFVIELAESGNKNYIDELKISMDSKDFNKMQEILKTVFQNEELSKKFANISKQTVEDWLKNMMSSLSPGDQTKASELLNSMQTV